MVSQLPLRAAHAFIGICHTSLPCNFYTVQEAIPALSHSCTKKKKKKIIILQFNSLVTLTWILPSLTTSFSDWGQDFCCINPIYQSIEHWVTIILFSVSFSISFPVNQRVLFLFSVRNIKQMFSQICCRSKILLEGSYLV